MLGAPTDDGADFARAVSGSVRSSVPQLCGPAGRLLAVSRAAASHSSSAVDSSQRGSEAVVDLCVPSCVSAAPENRDRPGQGALLVKDRETSCIATTGLKELEAYPLP